MALLYIAEFENAGIQTGDNMGVALANDMANQTPLSTAGASVQSTAFGANTTLVRLHNDSTSACSILFGTNPTAAVTDSRLGPNTTEYYAVPRGLSFKVAVVNNT